MQTANSVQLVVFIIFAVVASRLVRKGRNDPAVAYLLPRQRIRPLALEVLDPVLAIVVVGPVLGHEVGLSSWHLVAAVVGVVIGIPVGLLRARVQYVRAIKSSTSVVLTRSRAEYALVVLLIVLRSSEGSIRSSHASAITLLVALLLALPVGESFARSLSMVEKYRSSVSGSASMGLS